MVSNYWRNQSKQDVAEKYQKKASEASCATGVPCMFTQVVAYETKPCSPPEK